MIISPLLTLVLALGIAPAAPADATPASPEGADPAPATPAAADPTSESSEPNEPTPPTYRAGGTTPPTAPRRDAARPPARTSAPLTLEEVLRSVDATHPDLEAADQSVEEARAMRQGASGNWDPKVTVDGKWVPVGYYQRGEVDTVISQATPLWGINIFAGHRYGDGLFPVYGGRPETLSYGEVRAGLEVPLWKDGPIDAARADIQRADVRIDQQECGFGDKRLEVRRKAASAYWKWFAAGQEVRIQGELLETAQIRDQAFRERAALGSSPPILVVDNERLILDRRAKLISAKRDFNERALDLSLFWRSPEGRPIVEELARVPGVDGNIASPRLDDENADIQQALSLRPDLCELQRAREAAGVDVRLAKNGVAPDIRVYGSASKDLGAGPAELIPAELLTGVKLSIPIPLRKARGELRSARAKMAQIDAKLRGSTDQVAAEVRRARVDLIAAHDQLEVALRQVEVARTLAQAERDKLEEGASDLVIVNIRELAAADAELLEIEAISRFYIALADYYAATGNVDAGAPAP